MLGASRNIWKEWLSSYCTWPVPGCWS